MDYKVMLPSAIWKDYDSSAEPLHYEETAREGGEILIREGYFTALTAPDGEVRVAIKFFAPAAESRRLLLFVQEYGRSPEQELIDNLAQSGYIVAVPDISGVGTPATVFPQSLAYGEHGKSGEHLYKVAPTAKDTCQYLYSVIIKRALHLLTVLYPGSEVVLVGLGDGAEVAMQVAGSGGDVKGLACLNGAGYREYIKHNRYGEKHELIIDEESMCWLTGVASVAYTKYINVPVLVAIGSNSHKSDMDRTENLFALLATDDARLIISPRVADYLTPDAYTGFKAWLFAVFGGSPVPEIPQIEIKVSDGGKLYIHVDCDPSAIIESVKVYYSCGDYNHEIRDWHEADGISVSANEYIVSPDKYDRTEPFFAFANVKYASGFKLSSLPAYTELKGLPVAEAQNKSGINIVVVYQPAEGVGGFVEEFDGTVLMQPGLSVATTSRGLKGLSAASGSIRNYHFDPASIDDNSRILQIDLCASKETAVSVVLFADGEDGIKSYRAGEKLPDTNGFFHSSRFELSDFKDENMKPPESWVGIEAFSIRGNDILIGNILFI